MTAFRAPPAWDCASSVEGLRWPAIPHPAGAATLALLSQFEESQWLSPEVLGALQDRQIRILLAHACESVPHYRAFRGAKFAELPVLARQRLQENFDLLRSERALPGHGGVSETRTSGATGAPVRVLKTDLTNLFWRALTLRDHRWHRRDLGAKLAVIRQGIDAGNFPNWGPATEGLVATGPGVVTGVHDDCNALLDWLASHDPAYVLTYPSLVSELARAALARGIRLPALREIRTVGEALGAEARALCREAWGVPLTDLYSAQEVGYLALQCPEHEHYHVQCESVRVEVLRDDGTPCGSGEVGRVVVTDLHNFAMPLLRYDVGDYAEVGEPCPCGRGLPVLQRVLGRVRNTLVAADGRRYWPTFGTRRFPDIAPVLQHQFVQKAPDLLEGRLVLGGPISHEQEERLRERVLSQLPPGFRVALVFVDRIPRSASGKFEDFYSEISAGPR